MTTNNEDTYVDGLGTTYNLKQSVKWDDMSDFEKGMYLGMAYMALHNGTDVGSTADPTFIATRASGGSYPGDTYDFDHLDYIIPANNPGYDYDTVMRFDPEKFKAAWKYLYSGDEPGVDNAYQLIEGEWDLRIITACSESDDGIPDNWMVPTGYIEEEKEV